MRWGEIVGLETRVRPARLRPRRVAALRTRHGRAACAARPRTTATAPSTPRTGCRPWSPATSPVRSRQPCPCHGKTYVFRGHGAANAPVGHPGAKLVDVARRAGVSTGTVSNVLNHPDRSPRPRGSRWSRPSPNSASSAAARCSEHAAHWRRNGFATWLFHPAATGWYPKKAPQEARPVPVLGEPWPGVPARGRNAAGAGGRLLAADRQGPHAARAAAHPPDDHGGARHPPKLMDERMGQIDGSVSGPLRPRHPEACAKRLMVGLTEQWEESLDARLAMHPRSPVRALDALLRARQG